MSLEELGEKIHEPGYQPPQIPASPYTPEGHPDTAAAPDHTQETKAWSDTARDTALLASLEEGSVSFWAANKRKISYGLAVLALFLIIVGIGLRLRGMVYTAGAVSVSISGPSEVKSNETVVYKFLYANPNWTTLRDAEIVVSYPSTFRPDPGAHWTVNGAQAHASLGEVEGGERGSIELRGTFVALQRQSGALTAILRYTPGGRSRLDTSDRLALSIASSPLVLNVGAPIEVGNNQSVEYTIEYRNNSPDALDNVRIVLEYPAGFQLADATPKPSEGQAVWQLGILAPNAGGSIKVRGLLEGERDEVKHFTARLGKPLGDGSLMVLAETSKVTRIVTSPLSVAQTVNGVREASAEPGAALNFDVTFRNDGDIGVRDLILTIDLDPNVVDVNQLERDAGAYNSAKKQLTVRAADLPALARLAPGASGQYQYTVPVRTDLAARDMKNVVVETVARVDSPDIPTPIGANKVIASNTARVKVISHVALQWSGGYTFEGTTNTGPVPPVAGEETTYTLQVTVSSSLNDITNARMTASLPSGVRLIGKRSADEAVVFNERSGEMVWTIGTVEPGASRKRTLTYQVGVTPDTSQSGRDLVLERDIVFTGHDAFVGSDIELHDQPITVGLDAESAHDGAIKQ